VQGLCSANGVVAHGITKQVCEDSANRCEAYIKKGVVNGKTVTTCADFCSAHALQCVEQYDDHNDCRRGEKYADCQQSGGSTTDHICVCGIPPAPVVVPRQSPRESATPTEQNKAPSPTTTTTTAAPAGLCSRNGVHLDDVTRQVCKDNSDTCEVYIKKGHANGTMVKSCRDYCGAFNMGCKAQHEDTNGCGKQWKYETCDEPDDSTSDHVCHCVVPEEASPTPAPPPPEPPLPQACQDVWNDISGPSWEAFTCGNRITWLKTQGFDILGARAHTAEHFARECGACALTCEEVWNNPAGDYTCRERIEFLMYEAEQHLSEREAKDYVASGYPDECGACRPPPTPAPTPAPTPKPSPPPPPSPGSPARLLTFNVWWKNRQYDAIADLIIDTSADIVNLQEAVPFGGEDKVTGILTALNQKGKGTWAAATPWNHDAYWCGLTIYRSDYWKEPLWNVTIPVWQNSHVSKERGICGSLLERRVDDTRVCVWGGHPGWTGDSSPHWAMELIDQAKQQMKECAETFNAPSVFMCDCNSGNADAIKGQLEASTEANWDVAAHYGYDQIFVTSAGTSRGDLSEKDVPAEAFGKVSHFNNEAVHEGACCAGQQDRPCWRNAPMCSEWAYSDHPPVHVDIRLPLPNGASGLPGKKNAEDKAPSGKEPPNEAGLKPPPLRLI